MYKPDPDEKVITYVRKHWFIFVMKILPAIIVFILLPVAYFSIPSLELHNFIPGLPELTLTSTSKWFFFILSGWGLLTMLSIFGIWTNYYLDVWIITDKRVVDIEQIGLFRRETSSFRYEFIQDMTIETHGIIATFLKFGNIHVQTASSERNFFIKNIPNPKRVKYLIRHHYDSVIDIDAHGHPVHKDSQG